MVGENSTAGGEAIISGIQGKASFSAGYSKYETDGFRINNDQEEDIANVFMGKVDNRVITVEELGGFWNDLQVAEHQD